MGFSCRDGRFAAGRVTAATRFRAPVRDEGGARSADAALQAGTAGLPPATASLHAQQFLDLPDPITGVRRVRVGADGVGVLLGAWRAADHELDVAADAAIYELARATASTVLLTGRSVFPNRS